MHQNSLEHHQKHQLLPEVPRRGSHQLLSQHPLHRRLAESPSNCLDAQRRGNKSIEETGESGTKISPRIHSTPKQHQNNLSFIIQRTQAHGGHPFRMVDAGVGGDHRHWPVPMDKDEKQTATSAYLRLILYFKLIGSKMLHYFHR